MRYIIKNLFLIATFIFISAFSIESVSSVSSTPSPQSLSTNIVSSLAMRLLNSTGETEIDSLDLSMTPQQGGSFTKDNMLVEVSTNSPKGYSLYMESDYQVTSSYTTSLVHNDDSKYTIPTLPNTVSETDFSKNNGDYINYWGYSKSYTKIEDDKEVVVGDNSIYSPIPSHGMGDLLKETAEGEVMDRTNVSIGVSANMDKPSGTYSNSLLFTVVSNPVPVDYGLNFDKNTSDTVSNMPSGLAYTTTASSYTFTIPSNTPTRVGYTFLGWSTSASSREGSGSGEDGLYVAGDSYTMIATTEDWTKKSETLYAVWITPPFWTITTMQEMTSFVCNSVYTPSNAIGDDVTLVDNAEDYYTTYGVSSAGTPYVPQRVLYDVRDNNEYTIRKLADGNCWMTENLRLRFKDLDGDGEIGALSVDGLTETPITNANTNLTSKTIYLPEYETRGSGYFTEEYQDTNIAVYHSTIRTTFDGENQVLGGVYNYNAATAGSGTSTTPAIWNNARDSICPYGWRLPYAENHRRLFSTVYNFVSYDQDGHYLTVDQVHQLYSKPISLIGMGDNSGYYSWASTKSSTTDKASRTATPKMSVTSEDTIRLWTWYGAEIWRGQFARCINN